MQDRRKLQLASWAGKQLSTASPSLTTVSGDASFRRYFRFAHEGGSVIAVDSPPATENNIAFEQINQIMREQSIFVPRILKIDHEQGFMLLSDLGDQLYLPSLNPQSVNQLYKSATDTLLKIQLTPEKALSGLPHYSYEQLDIELNLFNEWFIKHHLTIRLEKTEENLLRQTFDKLIHSALEQPQVLVHRDYHSRNLMICENETPGVIDFQDAVKGPVTYDLVSLYKDCYIQWPFEQVKSWTENYYHQLKQNNLYSLTFEDFFRQFELMGMQRHIKVLGIFTRLNYRDNKSDYLKDLALTFNYLIDTASRYPEFDGFHRYLTDKIQPQLAAL